MSAFGGLILTNRGRLLQSKAQSGVELKYTRIALGDGELGTASILYLNSLRHEVKSLGITKLKVLGEGKAVVGAVLTNQDLQTGFHFREIGLFALDPDVGEILYCYGNAGALAEYIPASGSDIIEKNIDIQTIVGNATNVTAMIDSSLVWETVEGSQEKADEAEREANIYTDEKIAAINFPVTKVNGKTGAVVLTATDVGAETPSGAQQKVNQAIDTHRADYVKHPGYGVATGPANAYSVTLNPAPTSYVEGMSVAVKINVDNTGASTINLNNLGAKSIKKPNGNDVSAGNLKAGSIYTLRYNGTNFILQGEGGYVNGDKIPLEITSAKNLNILGIKQSTLVGGYNTLQVVAKSSNDIVFVRGNNGDIKISKDNVVTTLTESIMPTFELIVIDRNGDIYIYRETQSGNFVEKYNSAATARVWSYTLPANELGKQLFVDGWNDCYIVTDGSSNSLSNVRRLDSSNGANTYTLNRYTPDGFINTIFVETRPNMGGFFGLHGSAYKIVKYTNTLTKSFVGGGPNFNTDDAFRIGGVNPFTGDLYILSQKNIRKYAAATGLNVWVKAIGTSDTFTFLSFDSKGNLYNTKHKVDANGNLLWTWGEPSFSQIVKVNEDDGYMCYYRGFNTGALDKNDYLTYWASYVQIL